jgi:hypothetical protein
MEKEMLRFTACPPEWADHDCDSGGPLLLSFRRPGVRGPSLRLRTALGNVETRSL